jgi:DNA polymerase III delta' subunit
MTNYPWLQMALAQFANRRANLPHALLLSAFPGLGLDELVAQIQASVLCLKPTDGLSCGQCRSCLALNSGTHLDFYTVSPEEGKVSIGIDAIRTASEAVSKTPQMGGYQLTVVNPAHAMTVAAANALLKTLEEPTAQTVILLVSEQPGKLLPTIQSRCQRIHIQRPNRSEALQWLNDASPNATAADRDTALSLASDSPKLAVELLESGEVRALRELQKQLRQLETNVSSTGLGIGKQWQQNMAAFVRLYGFELLERARSMAQNAPNVALNEISLLQQKTARLLDFIGTGVRLDLALTDLLQDHQQLFGH